MGSYVGGSDKVEHASATNDLETAPADRQVSDVGANGGHATATV